MSKLQNCVENNDPTIHIRIIQHYIERGMWIEGRENDLGWTSFSVPPLDGTSSPGDRPDHRTEPAAVRSSSCHGNWPWNKRCVRANHQLPVADYSHLFNTFNTHWWLIWYSSAIFDEKTKGVCRPEKGLYTQLTQSLVYWLSLISNLSNQFKTVQHLHCKIWNNELC